jgi:predicted Zn-dependent protease
MTICRTITAAVTTSVLFTVFLAFSYAQIATPNVKQSDEVLVGRAMTAMQKSEYVAARTLVETLIKSHPDSDYVPRASFP